MFDDVLRIINKSKTSDQQMSRIWLIFYFFPIISFIVFTGFVIFSVLSFASTSYPFISANEYNVEFFSEFTYLLILFLITIFLSANKIISESKIKENRRDPILWAVLSVFLPFVSWFVNYFLMKDFYYHERREVVFWSNLNILLNSFNINFSIPSRSEIIPNRSFGLYLILTIVTVGFFGVYWIHILLRDPNGHFKYHLKIENILKISLNSISK
ncbi:MAG: hypothetical protein P8X91_08070 [Candidatus Bathyarchaeota archaeon]